MRTFWGGIRLAWPCLVALFKIEWQWTDRVSERNWDGCISDTEGGSDVFRGRIPRVVSGERGGTNADRCPTTGGAFTGKVSKTSPLTVNSNGQDRQINAAPNATVIRDGKAATVGTSRLATRSM